MPWFSLFKPNVVDTPQPVAAPTPVDTRPRVRISNEQQWHEVIDLAKAKFQEKYPEARITDAILHNPNGKYGVTYNIWSPNFRVEGRFPDGRTAMIEGLMSPLHLGDLIGDTKVTSFVDHVSSLPNSGRGVADL